MIPISEEDKQRFEGLTPSMWEIDDGSFSNSLYRIAKAAIEFNKTAVPVFHIAEEDRVRAERMVEDGFWTRQDGSNTNGCVRIAKAALEASKAVENNNAPKLTDINWSGLCDEKVWEDMFATGHLGAKTRGKTIAAEFQKCRNFAFSRVAAQVDDGEVKRLRQQIENHNRVRHDYQRRIESLCVQAGDCQHEIDSLKTELATLKEQANKPRVIRRF